MMGAIIALFARWGIAQRFRRPLAWMAMLIAAAALCGLLWALWLRSHDAAVVDRALSGANADFRQRQVAVERDAGAAKDARDADDAAGQQVLREKADDAARDGGSALDAVWDGLFGEGGEDRGGDARPGGAGGVPARD